MTNIIEFPGNNLPKEVEVVLGGQKGKKGKFLGFDSVDPNKDITHVTYLAYNEFAEREIKHRERIEYCDLIY